MSKKIIIVTIFITILILPDLILTYCGRDSYLLNPNQLIITMASLIFIILFIYLIVMIMKAIYHKQWKQLVFVLIIPLLVVSLYKFTVHKLTNISVSEARIAVGKFLTKDNIRNYCTVVIDDNAKGIYNQYLRKSRGVKSLVLTSKTPLFRIYEFEVIPCDSPPFFVRITMHQNEKNEIWIYSK